jgi:hypothetical protein
MTSTFTKRRAAKRLGYEAAGSEAAGANRPTIGGPFSTEWP